MDIIFDLNNVQIFHHREHKILHLKWLGPDCVDGYMEVLKALRKFTLDLEVEAWLLNLGHCQKMQLEGLTQLVHVANALTESQLKRYARVRSKDQEYERILHEKLYKFNKDYQLGLDTGSFDTEAEALAWLFQASEGTLLEEES